MRALVIDDWAKAQVQKVLDYASRAGNHYVIGRDGMPARTHLTVTVPGDNPRHVVRLDSYRCVFSYTRDERNGKLFRHLTISVPGDKYPNPYAAYTIAELFGFTGWDQKSSDYPSNWMIDINRVDRYITLLQEVGG